MATVNCHLTVIVSGQLIVKLAHLRAANIREYQVFEHAFLLARSCTVTLADNDNVM